MFDKYKKRFQVPRGDARVRHQIALEAARRMFATIGPTNELGFLESASESEYYTAKRQAAAVLGHRVRPGDLPSDSEVREQVLALARAAAIPHRAPSLYPKARRNWPTTSIGSPFTGCGSCPSNP